MSPEVLDWWTRALTSLATARRLVDADRGRLRVTSLLLRLLRRFRFVRRSRAQLSKHREVEIAVHRDLVKTGKWREDVGAAFSWLSSLRQTGDYGGTLHVSTDEAREAVARAQLVLDAVHGASPEPLPDGAN